MITAESFDGLEVETPRADLAALVQLLRQVSRTRTDNQPLRVVEVGSWVGRTAIAMADSFPPYQPVEIYCVDTWEGTHQTYDRSVWGCSAIDDSTGELAQKHGSDKVFRTFCQNAGERLFRRIFPCRGSSALWASAWPFSVDLVFIDADHSYEGCRADIEAWLPHVRTGGIMVGHDYFVCPGVNQAVEDVFGKAEQTGHCLWWQQL